MTGVPVAAPKNAPPGFAALLCALVVAMTFIPLLGYYIQRPPARKEPTLEEKRQRGFYGFYSRLVGRAIQHDGMFCSVLRVFADRRFRRFTPQVTIFS